MWKNHLFKMFFFWIWKVVIKADWKLKTFAEVYSDPKEEQC